MAAAASPACERDVLDVVADAARAGDRLAILGGGSKHGFGVPVEARTLSMAGLAGVVDYDPAELVLTVRPGTPLAEIQAMVAAERQMLAFEPFDHGAIYGSPERRATIGGVVAAGVAGSQRVSAGGARDHLLGFRAVSGHSQAFAGGAKVVKNVTGFDLPKLAAGSWGRLFVLTELTLKVLPAPRDKQTLAINGLGMADAVAAMAQALGSPADVAAAAHFPGMSGLTLFRLQGFEASIRARAALLAGLLCAHGTIDTLTAKVADSLWNALRTLAPLGDEQPLWRIVVPPSRSPDIVAALGIASNELLLDWAGGLIWMVTGAEPEAIRAAAATAGGHAVLVRAPAAMRRLVPTLHPQPAGLAQLEARVRHCFDPAGIFDTGRFL